MPIYHKEEMKNSVDLATKLQAELRRWGERLQVETVGEDWLRRHNLKLVPATPKVECIDERPLKLTLLRQPPGTKFPGASMGPAVLTAIQSRRPITDVLQDQIEQGRRVDIHDDDHHKHIWPISHGNKTGCGFHDQLAAIVRQFLELDGKIPEEQIPSIVDSVAGRQTSAARLRELTKVGATVSATYTGEHTGRRLVVNTLPGRTLGHLNPEGERSFVVDAGSAVNPESMTKLAAATVDVLLPTSMKIKVAILR